MTTKQESGISIEVGQGEYTLSLRALFQLIWRRIWLIALVVILLTGTAVGLSLMQTPVYEASAKILVNQEREGGGQWSLNDDVQGLERLTETVAQAGASRPVAEAVIQELGLQITPDALTSNLTADKQPKTQFVKFSYKDTDPERTQEIADGVATVTSGKISELSPNSAVTASVWESAERPGEPFKPKTLRNAVLALLLGIVLGVGMALLIEYLNSSWRSPEEIERVSGLSNLGVVPKFSSESLNGRASEEYSEEYKVRE